MEEKHISKKKLSIKDSFRILSFVFAAVLISACSRKIIFPASEMVPAAHAEMTVDKNKNNNYEIDLNIKNMAKPNRLTPSRRTYVVWLVTQKHGTINVGNLKISKKLKSSLHTITPYKPIRVFVTAEDDQHVIMPSTQVVLNSEEFKAK